MKEIRNNDKKLVAVVEETTHTVIIMRRGCETRIRFCGDGLTEITNIKHKTE